MLKRKINVYTFIKITTALFGKKRSDSVLFGVEEMEGNFKYGTKKMNQGTPSQRFRYYFPRQDMVDQIENVFVFGLDTFNEEEYAQLNAICLNIVYRVREEWKLDSTPEETNFEKKMF